MPGMGLAAGIPTWAPADDGLLDIGFGDNPGTGFLCLEPCRTRAGEGGIT